MGKLLQFLITVRKKLKHKHFPYFPSLQWLIIKVVWLWLQGRSTTDTNFGYTQFSAMEGQGSHWQAVCGGLTPASSWAPTQLLSQSLHTQHDGAENRKNRSKICELRHRQFNRWRKEKKANNKQEIIHLPQGHQGPASPWTITTKEVNPLLSSSSTTVCIAEHNVTRYRISLGLRWVVPPVSPLNVLPTLSLLTAGQSGSERKPWCCASINR